MTRDDPREHWDKQPPWGCCNRVQVVTFRPDGNVAAQYQLTRMKNAPLRKFWHTTLRKGFASFPRSVRFSIFRSFIDCDPAPDPRLMLKIADTKEELEACFRLLHDAYVASGFQKPDPSGMRATIYHALPTTTTLCATYDGEVVGTMSLIRDSSFGFPMQQVFELGGVRAKGGNIAEVSALAVHPRYRSTGGAILFPLMKFMYEYSTAFFDTRHLVIAVNPNRIEMYESLLFFQRLNEKKIDNYDFVNGAPAIGASLDLSTAPEIFKQIYGRRTQRKNLHSYFTEITLPNIVVPNRRYFTTNDPVMTPELLDYFFNQKTRVFENLDDRRRVMLRAIYDTSEYADVLPALDQTARTGHRLRRHQRYAIKCPASIQLGDTSDTRARAMLVIEASEQGLLASSSVVVPLNQWFDVTVQLGNAERSQLRVMAVRESVNGVSGWYAFRIEQPDPSWIKLVNALQAGQTHEDLQNASIFTPAPVSA